MHNIVRLRFAVLMAGMSWLALSQRSPALSQEGVTRSQNGAIGTAVESQIRQAARPWGTTYSNPQWHGSYAPPRARYPHANPTYPLPPNWPYR
jgi:hypothetical protein